MFLPYIAECTQSTIYALLASQYRMVIIYITAVLDLFTLNNVMLVKHSHFLLSLEKTIGILRQNDFIIILTRGLL